MNVVRTMMLEEVAMENWPKTSEWLKAHHESPLLWPIEFDGCYPRSASLPFVFVFFFLTKL